MTTFVPKQSVLGLQGRSIALYGGAIGLRDEGLLESALARPENLAAYGAPDMFALAAAYAFGIVRNHPFVDGNKRAAFLTAALFLDLNGVSLVAPEEEATAMTLALASGGAGEDDYAAWLREGSRAAKTRTPRKGNKSALGNRVRTKRKAAKRPSKAPRGKQS